MVGYIAMLFQSRYGLWFEKFLWRHGNSAFGFWVQAVLGDLVKSQRFDSKGCMYLAVGLPDLRFVLRFLRDDSCCLFNVLSDIVVVDYPQRGDRFEITYVLLSTFFERRIFIRVSTNALGTGVPSVVDLFKSAGWFEREAWDLFGIFFLGHPDLRRLLTDYGFEGHPLRKDFPLTGYLEIRYDEEKKTIVYRPLEQSLNHRSFSYEISWEGRSRGALE